MTLSGNSVLMPGSSGGAAQGPAGPMGPNSAPLGGPPTGVGVAKLTPQILGGPAYQGSMADNPAWNQQWQQAWNHYQSNPNDPNAQNLVQLVRSGYSIDQINQAQTSPNTPGMLAAPGQQANGLQALIQSQLASDPGIAGLNAQKSLYGIQGALNGQGTDLQRQQLMADTQNNLAKIGVQLQNAGTDKAYGAKLVDAANKEYGVGVASANTQFNSNLQSLYSDATAKGAVTTGGTRDNRQNLQQQLVEGVAGAGVQQEREVARGTHMMQTADQQAQSLGLDRQGYLNSLNFGLQSIGLQGSLSALDLVEKANSTDVSKASAAQAIINNLIGMAQQNPALLQPFTQGAGGTGLGQSPLSNYGSNRPGSRY